VVGRGYDLNGIRAYWSRHAREFDEIYERGSLVDRVFRRAIRQRHTMAIEVLEEYDRPTVCDVGCGTGRQMIAAVKAGASRAVGIELSRAMINMGVDAVHLAGTDEKTEFIEGDALDLEIDGTFDVVWALGVFDYIRDPLPLVKKMAGMSRGHVVASFRRVWALRNPVRKIAYSLRGCPIYTFSKGRVRRLFQDAGLEMVEVRRLGASGYLATGVKTA